MKEHMVEQLTKNCSPWEGPTVEKFMEDCLPWEGPHAEAGSECEGSSPEKEGAAERACDGLTITFIPCAPVLLGGRRERKVRSEDKPVKMGGVGGRCF